MAAIYNVGIEERSSTLEIVLPSEADMARRITDNPRPPVIVATRGDRIVGWAPIGGYVHASATPASASSRSTSRPTRAVRALAGA